MKTLYILAATAALSAVAAPAHAQDFTFSFSSDLTDGQAVNAVAGTVTGRILGLTDNATSAGTVWIDSYSPNPGASLPVNVTAGWAIYDNLFTVSGGQIVNATFHADRVTSGVLDQLFINIPINYANGNTNYASVGQQNQQSVWNNRGLGGVTFTPLAATAAVPEPSTWAMMLLGFGAVGFASRRRRQSTPLPQAA